MISLSKLNDFVRSFGFVALLFSLQANAAQNSRLTFNDDIRPILSDNCFNCHGQDAGSRKAELRLDVRDEALKGGKSGKAAIVPGKPEASELIARITTHDEDDVMPPRKTGKTLSGAQVGKLKEWIASGAEYQGHWAYISPQRPELPKTEKHPVDKFVTARLAKEKLSRSPRTDRATLLRRLSLDLTGIPPSPQELDVFMSDKSKDAYEKQVERLLASPRFGEKWARHWLDAARYADSDGYEKDLPRNQWLWRDWVIKAINRDLPYDKFIIEQVAGDLLPKATQDQRIATGFLRNGMVNEEGAILAEQFRMEGMFDRMDCIGKAVLGITFQCAQCHSHKYDPITHEEYYRLFAFMNNDYEKTSWMYSSKQLKTIKDIKAEIANVEADWKSTHPDWEQRLQQWENETRTNLVSWTALDFHEHEWVGGLAHPEKLPDKSILTVGFRPTVGELYVVTTNVPQNIKGLRFDALTHGDLPFNGPGRSFKGTFAVADLVVEAANIGSNNWTRLTLTNPIADFAENERPLEEAFRKADDKRVVGPAGFLIDDKDDTAWGTDRGPGRRAQNSSWSAEFNPTNSWPAGPLQMKITLKFRHGGNDIHGRHNNFLGRFQLSVTDDQKPVREIVPVIARKILEVSPSKRTREQQAQLFSCWLSTLPEGKGANNKIDAAWKKYPEGENILNLAQREPEFRRDTFIMDRGNWQKPTKKVEPGIPAFLHHVSNLPPNRLGLAQWLVDKNSPTTSRVFVNRVWQAMFGIALLETAEDFGVRAAAPDHPQLLDWLAVEFMEPTFNVASGTQPWSLKHLVRTILTSDTYQQTSAVTPKLLEIDPRNRLLSRGPRFRPDAEVVRDIALSTSGLLHESVGGPSLFPPVPESLFALSYLKVDFWKTAAAPERYRRSLYVFRRRSMPDPTLSSFDAPNADFACVRRLRSNTPLAALTSLNEPIFVEASRALAMRTLKEAGKSDEERAEYAFRLCTSRKPRREEVREILALLNSREEKISEGWLVPKEITASELKDLPAGTTPKDAAAWTIVSRVLLNLDETISKN